MSVGILNGNMYGSYLVVATLTPSAISPDRVAEQTFTSTDDAVLAGLRTGDHVVINPPSITTAVGIAGARVSAAGTLAVRFTNPTAGLLTPTPGDYVVLISRPEAQVAATSIGD